MFFGLAAAAVMLQGAAFNYTGPFTDLAVEGAAWGMPSKGLDAAIKIPADGAAIDAIEFDLQGQKWTGKAKLSFHDLKFSGGAITGSVQMVNSSGYALQGVRFDLVEAVESYKDRDAAGKEIIRTRSQPLAEDTPILLGEMPVGHRTPAYAFGGKGLKWGPETLNILVTARVSGLTYLKSILPAHSLSSLEVDSRGRLLIGSGQVQGIYRYQPDTGDIELVTSTPFYRAKLAYDPKAKRIAATMGEDVYHIYSEGGDEIAAPAMPENNGQPAVPRYDKEGSLYVVYWNKICRLKGGIIDLTLDKVDSFELETSLGYDLAADNSIVIGSGSNIFRVDGRSGAGRRLVQGPSARLGRVQGKVNYLRVDPLGQIWSCERTGNEYDTRLAVYDSQGRFLWVFGRGGLAEPGSGEDWHAGQLSAELTGLAFHPDGRVYASTWETANNIKEYSLF